MKYKTEFRKNKEKKEFSPVIVIGITTIAWLWIIYKAMTIILS